MEASEDDSSSSSRQHPVPVDTETAQSQWRFMADDGASAANSVALSVGCWNIRGLSSHKHSDLLSLTTRLSLGVLAVCETHLADSEQQLQWQLAVDDSQYTWHGLAAEPATTGGG